MKVWLGYEEERKLSVVGQFRIKNVDVQRAMTSQ